MIGAVEENVSEDTINNNVADNDSRYVIVIC